MALCEPHEGHWNPVIMKNGHLGNNIHCSGLKRKNTTNRTMMTIAAKNIFPLCMFGNKHDSIQLII
jgi:hypothetical protein